MIGTATAAPESFGTLIIVGTGLMGGSFALAARRAGLCASILGVDTNPDALDAAIELGIIDQKSNLIEAARSADCVVVATPPNKVEEVFSVLCRECRDGTLIMDLTSIKEPLLDLIDDICPLSLHFISVHPMAGREVSGPRGATGELFNDAAVILVPSVSTRPEAIERAQAIWRHLGSRVYQALPSKHDELVTGASHLPQLVAYALSSTLGSLYPDLKELRQISGPGLKGMIRTARSDPDLWSQILTMNHENTQAALTVMIEHLEKYREALQEAPDENQKLEELMRLSQRAGAALAGES